MFKKTGTAILMTIISLNMTALNFLHQDERETIDAIIHQYASSEAAIFANAFIVELGETVVIVDATLTVSSSTALRERIENIGKPVSAILITHAHPDHYNGLGNLAGESDIPIYSTQNVLDEITETDTAKEEQWTPMFGDEWPRNRMFPNNAIEDGGTITIEGVDFTVRGLGPGESHNDSYWLMEDGHKQVAFIGDVVLHEVHAYLADGHYREWLENLLRLEQELSEVDMLYPGHGEPGGLELLNWQRQYITTYVGHVEVLLGEKDQLSDDDKAELTSRMKKFLPNHKLEFLIRLSADVVAQQILSTNK